MNGLSPKTLIIAVAAVFLGAVLALVGAELPADAGFIQALPFWLVIACTSAYLLTTVGGLAEGLIAEIEGRPLIRLLAVGTATVFLVTIPIALMCLSIEDLMPDPDSVFSAPSTIDPTTAFLGAWIDQYINIIPATGGFWLFIKALDNVLPHADGASSPAATTSQDQASRGDPVGLPESQGPSALARRFPEIAGKALLAIEADEHYIRLHTDAGSSHVLYRFRDALKDVEGQAGLRVHRSWWVTIDAMARLEPSRSGYGLMLRGGLVAPVSQTYRRDVERALEARCTIDDPA